jgi:hypothetical protein
MMTKPEIRDALLKAGVKNLKEWGYPAVTKENILTDRIYKAFFKGMLEADENVGLGKDVEEVRLQLLREVSTERSEL